MNENSQESLVDSKLVKAYLIMAPVYLLITSLAGLAYSLQFLRIYPFEGIELLSPGRVRMVHTMSAAYGAIATAFFGLVYYVIPKLTQRAVLSKKLSWFAFYAYHALVVGTVIMILMGHAQGLEWAETPKILDPFIALVVVMKVINIGMPIFKSRSQSLYVSVWYILSALIWTPLVYLFGNFLPEYVFPGTGGATISSMYIHDLVGLFVTPIGIGLLYYLLPVVLNKPLYSHALSLIGFWGLAIFYPLNSVHHYLYSPIPMWAQYASVVASVGMHLVVYTVVFNVFATMAGSWGKVFGSIPLRFLFAGTLLYLLTCIQCAIQVTLSVQKIIHFTDWVVGHSHMVMYGTFLSWIFAWYYYLIPKLTGKKIFSEQLSEWHFWLSSVGIMVMAVDLGAAGLVQGMMWRSLVPFIDSVAASIPFWWVRMFSGVAIFMGIALFLINMIMTLKEPTQPSAPEFGKEVA